MAEKPTYEAPPPNRSLEDLLEAERVNLMQVRAMLKILYDVLLNSDDDDGVMHADVAQTIARLVEESVDQLEKIVRRFKAGEFGPAPGKSSADTDAGGSA